MLRPGYLAGETRVHLRVGDELHYTLEGGKNLPSAWERGIVVVEEVPSMRERPLNIAIVHRYSKATPCRHGGEALADADPKSAKAT